MPTTSATKYVGGSFAPPLPAETLAAYRATILADAPEDLRDSLVGLCDLVALFQATGESAEKKTPHPVGIGHVQKLEDAEIGRLWDACPWPWEAEALGKRANSLPTMVVDGKTVDSPVRKAAFHLVWFAKELAADREPCTADKLGDS
jgi:hypothetical protein